ncbi:hypothetical protein [Bradyrhizobium sp. SZCCHNRI1073]|uniref:hypothetical protein n=1 Tax=Bradyrhizobium sp. SZCCHNRI1073 TaxID=3057280 RepID=UPI00291622EC|nr:hypothetical protein [Bradyrhizobium sp. SZCCHNRI1073]
MSAPDTETITTSDGYEIFRVCTDMEALHDAFRDRVEDLNISRETLDELGGFTARYSAKLLCDPPMKWIGRETLPKMLKATGMAIVLVLDDDRFAPTKAKLANRKRTVRAVARIKRVKGYFTKENAGFYSKNSWKHLPPAKRSRLARKAANARWRAARRRKKLEAAEAVKQGCVAV